LLDLYDKNILHCIFKQKTNFCYFILRYKRSEWSDLTINPFHAVKHCRAQKYTVKIETYIVHTISCSHIQHRRSEWKERFLYCSYTYTWELSLCFPQERLQKLESVKVIQCWNLNRIVLFRQYWISQIRSTDKCDAWNKGQKRDTLKIGAKFSHEGNDNKENIWYVFVFSIQLLKLQLQ